MSTLLALLAPMALAVEQEPSSSPVLPLRWTPRADMLLHYEVTSDLTLDGARIQLALDLDCAPTELEADTLDLSCDIVEATLGSPIPRDDLGVATTLLEKATAALTLSRAGALRQLDVSWRGEPSRQDDLARTLATRALAGFDLPLPPNPLGSAWSQQRSAFLAAPAPVGPLGRADLQHRRGTTLGTTSFIETRGQLYQLFVDVALRPTHRGRATVASVATFDSAQGVLTQRTWHVASVERGPYEQTARIDLVDITVPPAAYGGPDAVD